MTEWLAWGTVPEQRRNVIDKYRLPFSKEELDAAAPVDEDGEAVEVEVNVASEEELSDDYAIGSGAKNSDDEQCDLTG